VSTNDTPFAHRVARPTKPTEPEAGPVRPETITPFAHAASKKPTKYVLEPMPLSDDDLSCEEDIEGFIPGPLTDDDFDEVAPRKPATISASATKPLVASTPVTHSAPAPVAVPQESSAMRQTLVALVAFIATTLVLLLSVVVWKTVFGK
jgi:hypothetical protein